jgi:hypothetical protein
MFWARISSQADDRGHGVLQDRTHELHVSKVDLSDGRFAL